MKYISENKYKAQTFCSERKALNNVKQSIKKEKGSNARVESNTTNRDYYDDTGSGYVYEYGRDYGYGNYYDEMSNSAKDGLGMFRSANKGNHLPSI